MSRSREVSLGDKDTVEGIQLGNELIRPDFVLFPEVCRHQPGNFPDLVTGLFCDISHGTVGFEHNLETVVTKFFHGLVRPLEQFVHFLEPEFLVHRGGR